MRLALPAHAGFMSGQGKEGTRTAASHQYKFSQVLLHHFVVSEQNLFQNTFRNYNFQIDKNPAALVFRLYH